MKTTRDRKIDGGDASSVGFKAEIRHVVRASGICALTDFFPFDGRLTGYFALRAIMRVFCEAAARNTVSSEWRALSG